MCLYSKVQNFMKKMRGEGGLKHVLPKNFGVECDFYQYFYLSIDFVLNTLIKILVKINSQN